MQLALFLFGSMEVCCGGQPVSFPTNACRALFAYLAVEADQPHGRSVLRTLLWPEHSQTPASSNLRQTLTRIRKALPLPSELPVLEIAAQTIQFRSDAAVIDVVRFNDLLAACTAHAHADLAPCAACVERLTEAAALYRGEFLQGLVLRGSQPFEEWLLFKREQTHRQMLHVLHTLTHAHEVNGNYAQMQAFAARQVALDPLHEEAHVALMRALALSGDRSAALAQYATCCRVLTDELGIEPSVATRMVFEQIRAGALTSEVPVRVPPHNLPAALTPFVGRDAELGLLTVLQRRPDVRLLTLVGAGGMGKTRLALELARAQLPSYADGVFLVSLAPLANAVAIAPTIAVALGVAVHGGDPRQAILNALQPKHLLLILDNFEHLLDGADLVVDILQTAPQVTILATSREPLNVRGEHPYSVHGLTYESNATPTEAAHGAAVRLFVQRAQVVQPHFTVDAHTVADVLRICQLVQGMPLGLELAAAWTATLPLGVIAAEIERSADFLAVAWRDAPLRHRSVRAVFDWSWDLLTNRERQVFKRLAAFRGGFTRDAALTIAEASLPLLVDLQRKSLLRCDETDDTDVRFDLHQLVHQFVAEHLDAVPEERAAVMTRLSAFYLALAETAVPQFYGPAQVAWLDRIERDHDNIRVALAWLTQQGDWDSALRLAGALRYFWFVRGYHTEGVKQLLHILAQPAAAGRTAARMHALNAAGYLLWVRGNTADAHTMLTEALTIGRATQHQADTAFTLCYLGAVSNAHNQYAIARRYLEESLAIWRNLGSENNIGLALMFLGDTMLGLGNLDRAQTIFAESADVLNRVENTSVLPYPLRRLAYVAGQQGNVERAASLYLDSLRLNWSVGDRQGVAASVVGLAIVAGAHGHWARAAQLMAAAESLVGSIHTQLLPFDRQQRDHLTTLLHTHLNGWEREAVWMAGRPLTLEQVLEVAQSA